MAVPPLTARRATQQARELQILAHRFPSEDKTLNKALLWGTPLRISDALRRTKPLSVSSSPPTATSGFAYRAEAGGAAAASDLLTKLAVVLLSSVNAVMWEVYTESRFMAAVWAMIAIGFAVWLKRDAARR
jgi:hypothetical protein